MLADLGLQHGVSPSAPTMQVKSLWVHPMLPKLDTSSWANRAYNQDEIYKSRQLKWWKKKWR